MNEALESFHQKDSRTARGIKDGQVPSVAVPWQYSVQYEVYKVRRGIKDPLRNPHECLVDAANELKWYDVEGILRPKAPLAGWHHDITADKVSQQRQVLLGYNALL